ncbi:MAG: uncharacterized membrane protein YsdA (DUF1294 family) [Patiriisocius sp.]|jgi:uncharacterized membrane protein YsdA (DUF1294 family)
MELITVYSQQILIGIFAAINIFSFVLMANDKRKALSRKDVQRTPEGVMFFMASMFGGLGVYAGMLVFRHKIRKWYFQAGIPLMILQNVGVVYLIFA